MFKKLLDSPNFWGIILGILMCFLIAHWFECNAQNVILKGDTFVQIDSVKTKPHPMMTKYFYQTVDGTKYPIYMSASGKCFILRTSKKTGKQYRKDLPKITEQLNGKSNKK